MERDERGPAVGDIVTLRVGPLANGGAAIGRVAEFVFFVEGAVPGELVRACVTERHATFARARATEVVEPAPERVTPPCPYFGACGGCQWQHIRYDSQLAAKDAILRDQLRRTLRLADAEINRIVRPPVGMRDPWAYRNSVRVVPDGEGKPAFHHIHSASLVAIDHCPISQPGISAALHALTEHGTTDETTIRLAADGSPALVTGRERRPVEQRLGGVPFRVSADAFFQVNTRPENPHRGSAPARSIADSLAASVLDALALTGKETVLDLYAGVGAFAILAAPHARRVIAVESVAAAATDARYNAERAGARNVEVHTRAVERFVPTLNTRVDAVILDPPRAGCAPRVCDALLRLRPARIIYVSCDVATLARDLRALRGAYRIASSQVFDMFPQTFHIESVTVLEQTTGEAA